MYSRKRNHVFSSKKEAAFCNALAAGVPLVFALMTAQVDKGAMGKQITSQTEFEKQLGPSPYEADKQAPVRLAQWFNWANACLNGQWRNC